MKSLLAVLLVTTAGCAAMPQSESIQVTVASVEPLPSEGLEVRMLVKLRIQNPNDQPIAYNGSFVRLDVMSKIFATGVSAEQGTVPRFGEAVIGVPVTVSVLRIVRQVLGTLDGPAADKVVYAMSGKLNGKGFGSLRFRSTGEFKWPSGLNRPD